jgi:hypothetical protein
MTIKEPAPAFAITMKEPDWYWALAMVCFALMNQTTKPTQTGQNKWHLSQDCFVEPINQESS